METMLHLLETFKTRGSDGKDYVVRGYEHLARLDGARGLETQWEPTGVAEYKLSDGRHVSVDARGAMSVPEIGLSLRREGSAERSSVPPILPGADALVTCDVCLREVPRSEAIVPEAADYVAYFCGLECFEKWKNPPP
ncbi:MAG TPA: DUF3330 domain-containing protein [Burkholderiaceae bacterium]|nr:DUF3330 domain-containing protein [Burkholderiaceae bacterium]